MTPIGFQYVWLIWSSAFMLPWLMLYVLANHDELQLQSSTAYWGTPMNTVGWAVTCARPSQAFGFDRSAGELTSRPGLDKMNGKLKLSSFHPRFLLICVGAGTQTRIHSIPAN